MPNCRRLLLQVAPRRLARRLQGRQEHRHEQADDPDHDQQFDEGETLFSTQIARGADGHDQLRAQRSRVPKSGVRERRVRNPRRRGPTRVRTGRSERLAASRGLPTLCSLRPSRNAADNALVGLLTSEQLEKLAFSSGFAIDPQRGSAGRQWLESTSLNTRLQRRGRPGISPEFPVVSAISAMKRPTTNARMPAM